MNPPFPLDTLSGVRIGRIRRTEPAGGGFSCATILKVTADGGTFAVRFWPEGWVRHFRFHCVRTLPLNFVLPPKLPKGTRVVIFPGGLLPSHAIAGHWTGGYRPSTPLQHIRGLFAADRPDPPLRYLRHYLRPTPWVAEAWRE